MALTVSHRCQNIAPSMTLSIDARAKEMKAAGLNVIGFGAGEPDFPTPKHICDAAKEAIDLGMTRYTPAAGTKELRKAICEKLRRDNDMTYTYGDILVSNGAKHSLFNIFQAILDPGDEVLIPTPCWVSYPELVRMAGGVPVFIPATEETNFIPTNKDIASRVTRRTKAIVITSPSNPNGSVWEQEQLQFVADLAVSHPFFVVSDEIYEKLIYDGRKHLSIAQLGEQIKSQTFLVNGVSKAYAMTGWRIGYAAGPAKIIKAMSAFQSHAASNANSIAQYATEAAISGEGKEVADMVRAFDERRKLMCELVNDVPGLAADLPHGAFYMMMDMRGVLGKRCGDTVIDSSNTFASLLLERKCVAVVPGEAFGAPGFARLSYAVGEEKIREGVRRMAEFVASLT